LASTVDRPRRALPPRRERAVEPYRLTPKLATRLAILGALTLVLFAALFLRLWALQVLQGSQYRQTALSNQLRTVRLQAQRGVIVDRNGRVLVTNAAVTAIEIWPADLPNVYVRRYRELRRVATLAGVPLYQIAAAIKKHGSDRVTPVTIKTHAGRDLVNYLAERRSEFPGIQTAQTWERHYPYGSLAAQLLGYVTQISPAQLREPSLVKAGYEPGDDIGQAGVEAEYDSYLRGRPGLAQMRVDARGRPRSGLEPSRAPEPGHKLRLTLDLGLQQAAERGLAYGISLARSQGQWAAQGGAIVVLDPRDGSILAMASEPEYEPSVYAGRVTRAKLARQGLLEPEATQMNHPALNRAIDAMYPPGSTFKPVTAIAALQEHLISPYATLPCTGTYVSPDDRSHHVFHNWDPFVDEAMDLPTALARSCDTYFYRLGNDFYRLPPSAGQPLQKWAFRLGFGAPTGVDVGPEATGLVPTIAWLHRRFTPRNDKNWQVDQLWKPGDSIQLAIGQKDLLVTPLQMARLYALIANGGKLVTPHLRLDVENPNGTAVPMAALPAPRQVPGLDPTVLTPIRQGLLEATHLSFGTSYGVFGHFPYSIAGKTGTAEKVVDLPGFPHGSLQNQSWWCGYGPSQDAKLVVCAVIENGGHGGTAAAPAALQVFEQFFHVKSTQTSAVKSD
jgi:penicillin-binding protein 2